MGHIKGFGVKNFRVFKDQTVLNFAPLTVFTGSNNSGKSSIINALIFLKENFSENSFFDLLENNNVSNFGQFDSILHSTKTSKFSVYFSIPWNTELVKGGSDWLFELTFSKDRKRKERGEDDGNSTEEDDNRPTRTQPIQDSRMSRKPNKKT